MKILFLFISINLSFLKNLYSQVPKAMPPNADSFYAQSMPLLREPIKNFILQNAKTIEHRKTNPDSLYNAFKSNPSLKNMGSDDLEGIMILIMVQASKNADADLKHMVLEIGKKNDKAKEMDEEQNLKLQMLMNRKSDMAEGISDVMKKISGDQQMIINSLK